MNEHISAILNENGIDPNSIVGEQTAFQFLEAAVLGALDEIEDEDNDGSN